MGRCCTVLTWLVCLLSGLTVEAGATVHVEALATVLDKDVEVPARSALDEPLNLASGTKLLVRVAVKGSNQSLDIALFSDTEFQKLDAGQDGQAEDGTVQRVEGSGGFLVSIERAGIWHLVLDNTRATSASRTVTVYAVATGGEGTRETRELEAIYKDRYGGLKELFNFQDFDIVVTLCGEPNAYSAPTITMCYELFDRLDEQGVPEAELFVFMHEVAHSLLNQWGLPLFDNEDAADEMATVLLMLLEQKDAAVKAAQWWSQESSVDEALSALVMDDRHTLSAQRARNIANWLQDPDDRQLRWERLVIPQMTTNALTESLKPGAGASEAERSLARRELGRRGVAVK